MIRLLISIQALAIAQSDVEGSAFPTTWTLYDHSVLDPNAKAVIYIAVRSIQPPK
jgi:hypothetical protein